MMLTMIQDQTHMAWRNDRTWAIQACSAQRFGAVPVLAQLVPDATGCTLWGSMGFSAQRIQTARTTELMLLLLCCFYVYAFYFASNAAARKQRWLLSADEQASTRFVRDEMSLSQKITKTDSWHRTASNQASGP